MNKSISIIRDVFGVSLVTFVLCLGIGTSQMIGTTAPLSVTWTYSSPTQYTDGTSIPAGTVITYNLYVGTSGPGSEASIPVQHDIRYSSAITQGYSPGQTVCGYVTAVIAGVESAPTNEACVTFQETPNPPTNVQAKVGI